MTVVREISVRSPASVERPTSRARGSPDSVPDACQHRQTVLHPPSTVEAGRCSAWDRTSPILVVNSLSHRVWGVLDAESRGTALTEAEYHSSWGRAVAVGSLRWPPCWGSARRSVRSSRSRCQGRDPARAARSRTSPPPPPRPDQRPATGAGRRRVTPASGRSWNRRRRHSANPTPGAGPWRHGPRIDGRRALVGGGSRGLGGAIAEALAAEGARVALSRPGPALDAQAARLGGLAVPADLATHDGPLRPSKRRRAHGAGSTCWWSTPGARLRVASRTSTRTPGAGGGRHAAERGASPACRPAAAASGTRSGHPHRAVELRPWPIPALTTSNLIRPGPCRADQVARRRDRPDPDQWPRARPVRRTGSAS